MKKLLATIIAVIAVLAMTVPAMADSVGTSVDIQEGTGNPPVVVCKWEGPDDGDIYYPNYTDPNGVPGNVAWQPGTQILPPLVWGAVKPVVYFAIVDDPQGDTSVDTVYVDVYHPECSPAPYDENDYFKYQLEMCRLPWAEMLNGLWPGFEEMTARQFFIYAWDHGLIPEDCRGINLHGPDAGDDAPYTKAEILELIDQQSIGFYMACGIIDYEQPAGNYRVIVKAVDVTNNVGTLENTMFYVPVSMIEYDFGSFSYGQVFPGSRQDVDGNRDFVVPDEPAGRDSEGYELNGATARNIGNVWSRIAMSQSDLYQGGLPLGQTGGVWNVEFWARMGDPDLGGTNWTHMYPDEAVVLCDILYLSTWDKIDMAILISKIGITGQWTGTMTLGSVIAEPEWPVSTVDLHLD
jgi:hypothetical protein